MKVAEIMSKSIVSVNRNDPLKDAARKMQQYNVGCLPVVKEGRLEGIITDRDIVVSAVANSGGWQEKRVAFCEQQPVWTIDYNDDIEKAAHLMKLHQVRRLPVMESGRLVGMISLTDMLRREELKAQSEEILLELSQPTPRARKI